MSKPMKLWEVVRAFETGSYIEGDWFVNELGQELGFDGEKIIGIENADVHSEWQYIEKSNVA